MKKVVIFLLILSGVVKSQTLIKLSQLEKASGAGSVIVSNGSGTPTYSTIPGTSTVQAWSIVGNTLGNNTGFIGSLDNTSFRVRTNNLDRVKVDSLGIVRMYSTTATPTTQTGSFCYEGIGSGKKGFNFYHDDPENGAYTFKFGNAANSYTQSYAKPESNFNLSQFTGLSNSTTYSVSVRVNVNSAWGSYGAICTVTTPSTSPTTSLTSTDCNITATSYTNQLIHAVSVGAATEYTYKLENSSLSYSQEYAKPQSNFSLNQFTGLTNATTYTVSVKVKFMGSYGPICTVTTPATFMRVIKDSHEKTYDSNIENLEPGFYIINDNGVYRKIIKQ